MNVNGSCHCGEISYSASVDPAQVGICHCTDCQKLSGSAYRITVPAAAETFVLLSGTPRRYVKTADSGARRVHAFCGTCGTPVYAHAAEGPIRTYGLRVGSIDQRRELSPRRQIWCRSALDWSDDISKLPRSDGQ